MKYDKLSGEEQLSKSKKLYRYLIQQRNRNPQMGGAKYQIPLAKLIEKYKSRVESAATDN